MKEKWRKQNEDVGWKDLEAQLARANDDTLPAENVLNEGVSGLHVHILVGACLLEDFIKVKNMLKSRIHTQMKKGDWVISPALLLKTCHLERVPQLKWRKKRDDLYPNSVFQ